MPSIFFCPPRVQRAGLWLAAALVFSFSARAVPPLQDVLGNHGYVAADYAVAMTWKECPVPGGPMYYGARLAPNDGSAAFDVYYTGEGVLLDASAKQQAGIVEKDWTWRSVTQPAKVSGAPAKQAAKPMPQPKRAGQPLDIIPLDIPDITAALQEDDAGLSAPVKGVQRTGVFQDLAVPVQVSGAAASLGAWTDLPGGGKVWAVTLNAAGAVGMRVHFPCLAFPAGAQVLLYNTAKPQEVYGPFDARNDFWAPTCFGESVTVECSVPAPGDVGAVTLSIDRIVYQYRDLTAMAKQSGSCNLDIACYPEYADAATAIGGIGTIGANGSLWCTGSLLSDGVAGPPLSYFLTADHCVSSVDEADTLEFYWLFGTPSCHGTVPDAADVPRTTGGADYLAGSLADLSASPGTDVTLMRIREAVPEGLVHSGYTTDPIDMGSDVICIHHPQGTYKRISFGVKSDTGSPSNSGEHIMGPLTRFHEILWNSDGGTTEPGSSGSPLFVELSPGKLYTIGQLYGGLASCVDKNEPDSFGRFDRSYPILATWLTTAKVDPEGESGSAAEGGSEGDALVEGEGEGAAEGEKFPGFCGAPDSGPTHRWADALLLVLAVVLLSAAVRPARSKF